MRRYSDRAARDVEQAVVAAGGDVDMTTSGHLKVTGPTGVAFVGLHRCSPRGVRNAITHIRRYAGLDIRL